jgi:hypothetical protein
MKLSAGKFGLVIYNEQDNRVADETKPYLLDAILNTKFLTNNSEDDTTINNEEEDEQEA